MRSVQAKELFSIRVRHSYYADQVCRGIALSARPAAHFPGQTTRFVPEKGLGRFYCMFGASVNSNEGLRPLQIELALADPTLVAFTDIEWHDPAVSILYFSNGADDLNTQDGELNLGSPEILKGEQGFLSRQYSAPLQNPSVQVLRPPFQKDPVLEQIFEGVVSRIDLALAGLDEGRYVLIVAGQDPEPFFLTHRPVASVFGVAEIFPGGPDQQTPPVFSPVLNEVGVITPRQFVIGFESRDSTWEYRIHPSVPGDEPTGWQLRIDGAGAPGFSSLRVDEQYGDCWVSRSDRPITFREKYPFDVVLENVARNIRIQLPAAAPGTTSGDSTIHVNL